MTPPKVLGTPKPASSVMISSTFGAPFGGTTRGAHQGLDWSASSLITPPNFGSGGGSCLPSIVVVAPGEPGVPVICWANAFGASDRHRRMLDDDRSIAILFTTFSLDGRFHSALHRVKRGRIFFSSKNKSIILFCGLCIFGRTNETSERGLRLSGHSCPLRVIRDRVEPAARPAMSAMPPKAEINSGH
jgi:hypothetical protein